MGIWQKLLGKKPEIDHPTLGRVRMQGKTRWSVDSVPPLGCKGDPELTLVGDETGPSEDAVHSYDRLRSQWESIAPDVASDLFELHQEYCEDLSLDVLASPDEIWPTARLHAIDVSGDGDFELVYTFDWQASQDDHVVLVHFEQWKPQGTSIDG